MKRLINLFTATLLSLSSMLVINLPLAHANPPIDNWTGGDCNTGGSCDWNDANNWDSGIPAAGDDLVFDNTNLTQTQSVNNGLTNVTFDAVEVKGTGTFSYTITGNALSISTEITCSDGVTATTVPVCNINVPVTFTGSTGSLVVGAASLNDGMDLAGQGMTSFIASNLDEPGDTPTVPTVSTITGSGDLGMYSGDGTAIVGDSPNYTGLVHIESGTLKLQGSIGTGKIEVAFDPASGRGGTLEFDTSSNKTFTNELDLTGPVASASPSSNINANLVKGKLIFTNGGSGSFTDTLSGPISLDRNDPVDVEGAGNVANFTGTISGGSLTAASGMNGTLQINGSAVSGGGSTTTISDDQPGTDATVASGDTVVLDGTRDNVEVQSGGTLKGSGSAAGDITVDAGGTVAPGHSPGCLSSASLTINGTYQAELGGTTPCTGYDQMQASGNVDVTNGTLDVELYGGFVPAVGNSFTIIDNQGSNPVTGTFSGMAEGASFTKDGVTYSISYVGGDGNDVVLKVTAVSANAGSSTPAPGTPDTGLAAFVANPVVELLVTLATVATLVVAARRLSLAKI